MQIVSPAFTDRGDIPARFTCEGDDTSPPLSWSGVPREARSLALVVDDPSVMWRLFSARLIEGRRLDTLIIARRLLPRGDTAIELLVRERSTEPLVRAIALTGGADEFALNELADARPLFVELDRGWGRNEYSHVRVEGAWLKFEREQARRELLQAN